MMRPMTCLLLLSVLAAGQEEKQPQSLLAQVRGLEQSFKEAQQAFIKKYRAAKEAKVVQRVLRDDRVENGVYAKKFMAIADAHPTDPAACQAWLWVVTSGRSDELRTRAYAGLLAHQLDSPDLGRACRRLERDMSPAATSFLETVLEKSPVKGVKGSACFALAQVRKRQAAAIDNPERLERAGGPDFRAALEKRGKKELEAEAEKLFVRVCEEFGGSGKRGASLGARAQSALFELRHLTVGKKAPEIVGEDGGEVEFKLSDYAGKVVVIDFWGDW